MQHWKKKKNASGRWPRRSFIKDANLKSREIGLCDTIFQTFEIHKTMWAKRAELTFVTKIQTIFKSNSKEVESLNFAAKFEKNYYFLMFNFRLNKIWNRLNFTAKKEYVNYTMLSSKSVIPYGQVYVTRLYADIL